MIDDLTSRMGFRSVDASRFSFFGDVDLELGALDELKHKHVLFWQWQEVTE